MDRAERLAEIRKRWKAPRNPIREYEYSEVMEACDDIKKARALILSVLENGTEVMRIANNAIEDIPFLLGEISRLESEVEHWKKEYLEFYGVAERLEAENAVLRRERDAAVKDMQFIGQEYAACSYCKFNNDLEKCRERKYEDKCWQWRGAESEESHA